VRTKKEQKYCKSICFFEECVEKIIFNFFIQLPLFYLRITIQTHCRKQRVFIAEILNGTIYNISTRNVLITATAVGKCYYIKSGRRSAVSIGNDY
jgi:hypothetical protein